MFIFLDESGDLGFDFSKRKTTRKFVITLLVCTTRTARRDIEKAVRRTLKNKLNRGKHRSRIVTELKGSKTTLAVKKYCYSHIRDADWKLYALVLNKERVHDRLKTSTGKKKLYNYLSRIIIEKLEFSPELSNVELIVDKSKNKRDIRDFNQYMINHLEALLPLKTRLNISHLDSMESKGLQAVDLFCWGIRRKYEYADEAWYGVFRERIAFETLYLP